MSEYSYDPFEGPMLTKSTILWGIVLVVLVTAAFFGAAKLLKWSNQKTKAELDKVRTEKFYVQKIRNCDYVVYDYKNIIHAGDCTNLEHKNK